MLYGILTFVFQMESRREANREMTMPQFQENLKLLFPELDSVPHQDTLARLLAGIEVDQIQETLIALIQHFIRKKKFYRYLVSNRFPIAMDGTQKLVRNHCWAEQCLERQVKHKEEDGTVTTQPQYYVYVLEANFAFPNGMTIPLMSEFLSYTGGDQSSSKQDCELKAFKRLAEKIKQRFPRLPIQVLLDGLYPSGPVLELCRQYHWQFMIVPSCRRMTLCRRCGRKSGVWKSCKSKIAWNVTGGIAVNVSGGSMTSNTATETRTGNAKPSMSSLARKAGNRLMPTRGSKKKPHAMPGSPATL